MNDGEQGSGNLDALTTQNGLTSNGLTSNGLTSNGLTSSGLEQNADTMNALRTQPIAREFLTKVVGCALPASEKLDLHIGTDGAIVSFYGELGLAPEWGFADDSACGPTCREWVSACVLSRVNYLGEHMEISLRGAKNADIAQPSATEQAQFSQREGAYFGNLWSGLSPAPFYACRESPDSTLISRVCGPNIEPGPDNGCAVKIIGYCRDVCSSIAPIDGSAAAGYYTNCHVNAGDADRATVITVFRQQTR